MKFRLEIWEIQIFECETISICLTNQKLRKIYKPYGVVAEGRHVKCARLASVTDQLLRPAER